MVKARDRWSSGALVAAALCVAGAGCAHLRGDASVCPEYRDLRCATAPECSMDERRGCRVCGCGAPPAADRGGSLPSAVKPDQRTPAR